MTEEYKHQSVGEQQQQQEDTSLVQYKAPLIDRIKAGTADLAAQGLDTMESAFALVERTIKAAIDNVMKNETSSPRGIIDHVRNSIAHVISGGMKKTRENRLLEKADIRALPALSDNQEEDDTVKGDINDILDSRIAVVMSFEDEMDFIGKYAFKKGIPPIQLVEYFESEVILDLMVGELLSLEYSRFRGTSVYVFFKSIWKSFGKRLRTFAKRKREEPVQGQVEEEIKRKITYLRETYDPFDKERTTAAFVQILKEEYPNHDLFSWLKANKKIITEILRGQSDEDKKSDENFKSHVYKVIQGVYERAGTNDPRTFIKLNMSKFVENYSNTQDASMPLFNRLIKDAGGNVDNGALVLDIDSIESFFQDVLPRIESDKYSLAILRKIMIEEIQVEVQRNGANEGNLILRGKGKIEAVTYKSNGSFKEQISTIITQNTRIMSSHIDVRNLLIDPTQNSPELQKHFAAWFAPTGKIKSGSGGGYYAHLRSLFSIMSDNTVESEAIDFTQVKNNVKYILVLVNDYLDSISQDLGIPSIKVDGVAEVNDYAELVKIACTGLNKEERFAARRKIELATLVYSCLGTPRKVYQDHEALAIKSVLEKDKNGIKIDEDAPLREVHFIDYENGEVKISEEGSSSFTLIPGKLGNTDCYLLPAGSENDGNDPREYVGKKSLFSMLTNLLSGEKKRAEDLTDLVRMTFVVDSIEDLVKLQEQIEDEYISFGRTLKRENRYGEFVKVGSFSLSKSAAKSSEYKSLRYVVDIPIWDEAGAKVYFAPIEIRILLTEDLAKEKSKYNDASHKKYEHRRLSDVYSRVEPVEVFEDRYKTVEPHPDDAFKISAVVPKTTEDYKIAA